MPRYNHRRRRGNNKGCDTCCEIIIVVVMFMFTNLAWSDYCPFLFNSFILVSYVLFFVFRHVAISIKPVIYQQNNKLICIFGVLLPILVIHDLTGFIMLFTVDKATCSDPYVSLPVYLFMMIVNFMMAIGFLYFFISMVVPKVKEIRRHRRALNSAIGFRGEDMR